FPGVLVAGWFMRANVRASPRGNMRGSPHFSADGSRRARKRWKMAPMSGETTGGRVRLAEIVASLSLGIDLGFGQPMEHVLRQCLISLRIAEDIGLDDQQRAGVYYTSL